jgi:hypothetical protein
MINLMISVSHLKLWEQRFGKRDTQNVRFGICYFSLDLRKNGSRPLFRIDRMIFTDLIDSVCSVSLTLFQVDNIIQTLLLSLPFCTIISGPALTHFF